MNEPRRPAPDQDARDFIASRFDLNLVVEAGAGSGKTQSLADRMAAGIAAGRYLVEHMAAVTFTRKAAAELRGRFQLALEERLRNPDTPEGERPRLRVALASLERLFAGTIHSFCARLLRERPVEANLAPGFTELDAIEDAEMRRRAWREYVARERAKGAPVLRELIEAGIEPRVLEGAFDTVCTFEEVTFPPGDAQPPDPRPAWTALRRFLRKLESRLQKPIDEATTCKVQQRMRECRWRLRVADPNKPGDVAEILRRWDSNVTITQKCWSDDRAAGRLLSDEIAEIVAGFREEVVGPYLARWRQYVYRLAITLLTGARDFARQARYNALTLNYTDLLQGARRLLADHPEVRRALQQKYRWLFVDEFQDTDPVQAEVILMLAGEPCAPPPGDDSSAAGHAARQWRLRPGSLFIVGDPKQSIYRFRRADIQVYNLVRDIIVADGGQVVSLTTSFRALPALCRWANDVFRGVFPERATPHQPAFEELRPYRAEFDAAGAAESRGVMALTIPAEVDKQHVVGEDARRIAACVRSQLAPAGSRAPGDFLVLTATRKHLAVYADALEALGIPVEVTGAGAFGDSAEVRALVSLLAALGDPDDEVATVGVLRGPLFGTSDEALFAHKQAGGTFSFLACSGATADAPDPDRSAPDLPLLSRAGPGEAQAAVRPEPDGGRRVPGHPSVVAALASLAEMLRLTRELPLPAALERMLEKTGLLALAAARSTGAVGAGDLQHAVDCVRRVLENGGTLADAALALDEAAESADEESWPLEPGRTDVVRVMNVHKAKGLEAPVVFLADPCGGPKEAIAVRIERQGERALGWLQILKDDPEKDYPGPIIAEPADWEAHAEAERPFLDAERERVRYVAATRARDLLVVSRWAKPAGGKRPWAPFDAYLSDHARASGFSGELVVPAVSELPATIRPDLSETTRARLAAEREARRERAARATFLVESVTARTHRAIAVTEEDPARLLREPASGAEWGDLIHALLEHAMRWPDAARADLERLARWLTLGNAELEGVIAGALDAVERVRASAVWQRAQAADECHVEVPIAVSRKSADGRLVVLMGVIDLVYRSARGWHIVDYKTDQLQSADGRELVDRYGAQLDAYAAMWTALLPDARVTTGLHAVRAGVTHWRESAL